MELIEVTYTHELIAHEDRLNQFLALGWRIVAVKTQRCNTGGEEFDDLLSYVLGTDKAPVYPEGYDPLWLEEMMGRPLPE